MRKRSSLGPAAWHLWGGGTKAAFQGINRRGLLYQSVYRQQMRVENDMDRWFSAPVPGTQSAAAAACYFLILSVEAETVLSLPYSKTPGERDNGCMYRVERCLTAYKKAAAVHRVCPHVEGACVLRYNCTMQFDRRFVWAFNSCGYPVRGVELCVGLLSYGNTVLRTYYTV